MLSTRPLKHNLSTTHRLFHTIHTHYHSHNNLLYNIGDMFIRSLSLASFRNYENLEFEPAEGSNILFGLNAQGKSAILEAVYLLATSKSHRTSRDSDMIRIGSETARACAEVSRSARNDVTLEVALGRSEKKMVRIDRAKHARIGDLVGQLNAVMFSSIDIDMVRGEPLLRRRFLNLEISQMSPQYVYALGRYKRVLDQRNSVLKEIRQTGSGVSSMEVWDAQLATYGATVTWRRSQFVELLSLAASRIYESLTNGSEKLGVRHKPSTDISQCKSEPEVEGCLRAALSAKREVDVARGTTTVGPHRDDLALTIDGLSVREYGSQGQQRTVAVAMKLAEIELIRDSAGEPPVVLLDDIMAELDEDRRKQVLALTAGNTQTLLTTTNPMELDEKTRGLSTLFEVSRGRLARR